MFSTVWVAASRAAVWAAVAAVLLFGASVAGAGQGAAIDLEAWVPEGGMWVVEDPERGVVVQYAVDGGNAYLRSPEGFVLPEEFTFSAKIGVIAGNNRDARPFLGLGFNATDGQPFYRYEFRYRQSNLRYELRKEAEGISGYAADHHGVTGTWAWNLEEWRRLTVIKKGDLIQTYAGDELIHEVTDASLSGGGLFLYTFSTSARFEDITFVPEAVHPSELE